MQQPKLWSDEYSYPLHSQGSVSTLPGTDEDEVVKQLHQVVKEITGKDVEQLPKRRIGFLE